MGTLTLSLKSDTIDSLRKDYDAFVRLSGNLDPYFVTPSFDDFLRARLLDNTTPLTEQAVQQLLQNGQYAWAKRTLSKDSAGFVSLLMRQAGEFGFALTMRAERSPEMQLRACRDWATAIVTGSGGDHALIDSLASQLRQVACDIQALEEEMQTPAWRLAESLRQRVYEAKLGCETASGSAARERFGELRGLLRLALQHEVFNQQEAQQILDTLRLLKPELFIDEPQDIFARVAAWLRALFIAPAAPQRAK